jgi:hypothetical protein
MIPTTKRMAPTIPPTTPPIIGPIEVVLFPPPVVEGPFTTVVVGAGVVAACIESATMSCDRRIFTLYTYSCSRWICWAVVIHYFNCGIEPKKLTTSNTQPIEYLPVVKLEFEGHPLASVNDTLKGTDIPLQSQVRDTFVDMAVAISVAEPTQSPILHSTETLRLLVSILSSMGYRREQEQH